MYTEEDSRRLLEARRDIQACERPADITPDKAMQHALTESRDELSAARDRLQAAAAIVDREHSETDAERLKLAKALTAAIRRYGFVRSKVSDALLNVDPDDAPGASEMERRQRLYQRVFGTAPSDMERMGQGPLLERLGHVIESLNNDPDLAPLKLAKPLATAHKEAQDAARSLGRETREDAEAMRALRVSREVLDRAAKAHALLVESILVRQGREDDLGHFVLEADPAYAARRAAHVPVAEEAAPEDLGVETPAAEKPA